MLDTLRTKIRTAVRAYLGTDTDSEVENNVTTMLELLNGLVAKTDEASAAQQASFQNMTHALTRLEKNVKDLQALVDNPPKNTDVPDEVKALAAKLAENLETMRKAAETADDGFTPAEPDPATPTPVDPADPTTDPLSPVGPQNPVGPGEVPTTDPNAPIDAPVDTTTPVDAPVDEVPGETGRRGR